jgi:hypothetical protein
MTVQFIINQPPQFTRDSSGQIISVLLIGKRIFTRMTQITIDNNDANPTQGQLNKSSIKGTIDATASEFSQVCNAVEGMLPGETRTLEIEGTEDPTTFSVSHVRVLVPGARVASHITALRPGGDGTGTGTEG